ncbi:hypothetical protein NHX12_024500 [Muraenolepis orangiensis]|uniref:trypsin n=1 Tax=Muraenolepis orangiensis TaxID=630683 RepID=A0A9Q0IQS2_9TELE|nr:hypothetical protein NHX12_024500 [Muraenolepis orangiensis]
MTYEDEQPFTGWWDDYLDATKECDPNPCNRGICKQETAGGFTCSCPEPYSGRICQNMKDVCKNVSCGRGDCLLTSVAPFYRCKCQVPFIAPTCNKASACKPNPCQNGGSCIKIKNQTSFRCLCHNGFTGKFCQVGPSDCMEGEGVSYRGMVSVTKEGRDCLHWNSGFIRRKGVDIINDYPDSYAIGEHNFCRNPDWDTRPWCYVKLDGELEYEHCNIRSCSAAPPTLKPSVVPVPPTEAEPQPGQFSQCGQPQHVLTRIIGGRKSLPGAHPWQVSVQMREKGFPYPFRHQCGGILIGSCWVLTAGHCISDNMDLQVMLGGLDISNRVESTQIIPVKKTFVHKDYRKTPDAVYNDVAMLQLKTTDKPYCAKETRFVKAPCLPLQPFSSGTQCVVSGWGVTKTKPYGTNLLLDARVVLISDQQCKQPDVYGNLIDDSMFCAGNMRGGVDSCQVCVCVCVCVNDLTVVM